MIDRAITALDRRLLAWPRPVIGGVLLASVAAITWQALPNVPKAYADLSSSWLGPVQRYDTYGPDSLSDMFGTRVIANDVRDMYTKARTDQTALEAATWSREASAPYPPVVLLAETALFVVGERVGIGFYGMILGCAVVFLGGSLVYFARTRWYLFPLLYVNFGYLGYRFVYVQDNTYLVMLVTLLGALFLARWRQPACHAVMALATTMKLSPVFYASQLLGMSGRSRIGFLAILVTGLILPYFVWDNYLYIYRYGHELKGDALSTMGAALVSVPFAVTVWYVQERRRFDLEDRVGWCLVPFALFLALKMNVARHLLLVLLVPDKRGARNVAAAAGLLVPTLAPSLVAFNTSLAVAACVLCAALVWHLWQIGWVTIQRDLRHPVETFRTLVAASRETLAPGRPSDTR